MKFNKFACASVFIVALVFGVQRIADAQAFNQGFTQAMHWRSIGPFRGGRTRAISGVASQPNVFYIGATNGGVWKTTDFGRIWTPIFDDQPTGSIGAIAVANSNPNVVYVGSGEGLHRPDLSVGDGMYKSTDAGKTWTHLGLRDGQQISEIKVDPTNENKLFVAVAGHPYAANAERGIYRSLDGGKTFERVLYVDENTGGADVEIDPTNPNIIYGCLWESREGPWENAAFNGTNGGIFKSVDGGKTWNKLTKGLPAGISQAAIAVAPSDPKRLFAAVRTPTATSLYRSDDAGDDWNFIETDTRPTNRIASGDLGDVKFDPKNAHIIYAASVVTWKSTDGGKNWTAFRGAPGGDDYQNIWINPNNTEIIALSSDQGAIVSVNGGTSWSSWYNQSTAQMYHVSADNHFPYRLCSGQQESGSACVSSRGDDGEITFRDWHPVAAEEYGYIAADPLDPEIVYGGKLTRYDRRTGQAQNILPKVFRGADFRMLRTEPVIFSPVDNRTLFFAGNTLWKTLDGGQNWEQISQDLTRKTWEIPASVGKFKTQPTAQPTERGVIYTVAPSYQDINRIWIGTDDGLIQMTSDGGKNWTDITPKQIGAWQKISIIDAGHFDNNTAYAAVNTLRLDDIRPHIYRTRDAGKTWTEITKGIPDGETVNVVREDSQRKGLLFAGTERAVYVSFDDGDNWQSLRLNMPATSIRDLIVKDDDIAVGTHGRGFWILDDITPLRQYENNQKTLLFKPQTAMRVRWNLNTDTPLPPDEPAGENPPDGAIIDYFLDKNVSGAIVLEIRDDKGNVVRRYSSADETTEIKDTNNVPAYWIRPAQTLSTDAGTHRFMWDLHYQPVPNIAPQYPIAAVYRNTAPDFTAPWVLPGNYSISLTVGGKTYTQPLTVKMDPRVKTSEADLRTQFDLSKQLYDNRLALEPISERIDLLNAELVKSRELAKQNAAIIAQIDQLGKKINELAGASNQPRGTNLSLGILDRLTTLFGMLQEVDAAPTPRVETAAADVSRESQSIVKRWKSIESQDVPALNKQLQAAGFPKLEIKE